PCDVGVFAPLKAAYRDEAERLFQGGANIIGKQYFTSLYSPAREKALFPFNPDRVFKVTPRPPAQSTVPRAEEIKVGCHQDEVPQTPVTPVLAKGLASLYNLIRHDTYTLGGTISFAERAILDAERALLYDQNQTLISMNNEAKVRRSTRSIVLGKAKVMSFEDIEVEVIKDKGKRGRKRKSDAVEAGEPEGDEPEPDEEEPEPELEVTRAAKEVRKGRGKRGRKRKSAALGVDELEPEPQPEVAQIIEAPGLWRAPVARMY
ncbi:hypothetical protein LSUE1_G009680, partial [Lachnellula suecica]